MRDGWHKAGLLAHNGETGCRRGCVSEATNPAPGGVVLAVRKSMQLDTTLKDRVIRRTLP